MTNTQFNYLYDNNINALYNFAKKLTKNIQQAEDLVQETLIKAFKKKDSFIEGSSFKSWTFTILKNTFITQIRKTKRKAVVNAPVEDLANVLPKCSQTLNPAYSNMRVNEIKTSITELSYKTRMPFLLFVEGYKYEEISNSLNIPTGTVKSRINAARTKLRTILKSKGIKAA